MKSVSTYINTLKIEKRREIRRMAGLDNLKEMVETNANGFSNSDPSHTKLRNNYALRYTFILLANRLLQRC